MKNISRWRVFYFSVYVIIVVFFTFIFNPKILRYNWNINLRDLAFSINTFVILLLIILLFGYSLKILQFNPRNINPNRIFNILVYFIVVAIAEEIIFRGLIQNGFINLFDNASKGLIISSLIFGLSHLPNGATGISYKKWSWKLAILASIAGFFFGFVYIKTSSMFNAILVHFLILLSLLLFSKRG